MTASFKSDGSGTEAPQREPPRLGIPIQNPSVVSLGELAVYQGCIAFESIHALQLQDRQGVEEFRRRSAQCVTSTFGRTLRMQRLGFPILPSAAYRPRRCRSAYATGMRSVNASMKAPISGAGPAP